jgi:NAD+ synthase
LVSDYIVDWLRQKAVVAKKDGFVVGVSGGIDSALVSALCAKTGLSTIGVSMPINQAQDQLIRAHEHCDWLTNRWANVDSKEVDLTGAYEAFEASLVPHGLMDTLSKVNSRSRIRMMALYAVANTKNLLVAGTGNKIEDFGIGFFTKYGDGGVDLSPIGDLTKTEVRELAQYLGVIQSIVDAKPTDGLWGDNRSDEDQIGDTYADLEIAMRFCDKLHIETTLQYEEYKNDQKEKLEIQEKTLYNYLCRHESSKHKMRMPPVCHIEKRLRSS